MVVLGSYNWTTAGAYDNDENTRQQSYYAEWERLWGTLEPDRICNAYDVYLPVVVQSCP